MAIFEPVSTLKWLYLDLNSFFASCEQDRNPALRHKPIAVVPMMADGTCAIAASIEAKRCGIKTGTKIYDAKRMCPDLICVLAKHDLYVEYHHKILDEVIKHVPINKVWSIDELSSRLPPNKQNRDSVLNISRALKNGLKQNVGDYITASIGIAPNQYLAKIATDMQKPDGLIIIEPHHIESVLESLKLTDLPGINVRMQARLNKSRIYSPIHFYHLSPKQARAVWGSVEGEKLWYKLHGYDVPDRETHRSVIGHSRILDPEHRGPDVARLVLRRLVIKAASRLRRLGLFTSTIHVSIKTTDHEYADAAIKISPTQDNFTILTTCDALWSDIITRVRPFRLRKVAVDFGELFEPHQITDDLFAEPPKIVKHHADLDKALDSLNQKYGAETVRIGISPKTSAGFVGTKIAFNRIPDVAEFAE
jgi:DNA polymerase-4